MTLTDHDIAELTLFRRELHRHPEVSGAEVQTAARVVQALSALSPDRIVTGLGGQGVAAVFAGAGSGPTVMLRAELDALPIHERTGPPHRSLKEGVAHLCGHDGHSTILLGAARVLSRQRPRTGRVVLMFQPAEEDGSGAAAVLADPDFAALRPDWAFALHNMPGVPLAEARVLAGPFNCASCGMKLRLSGRTAHAGTPETGLSPVAAMLELIPALRGLGAGGELAAGFRLVTVTHLHAGEPSFGISPGDGEVWVTLRTLADADMIDLKQQAEAMAGRIAAAKGLELHLSWHDDFAACHNDAAATAQIEAALDVAGVRCAVADGPMRASEDFGRFAGSGARSAMFLLGAGEACAPLHAPDYDFPDALIAPGVATFTALWRRLLD
jgi:amidohydrolase